jgi:hypothetical protein
MAACGAVGRGFKSLWTHFKSHVFIPTMDYTLLISGVGVRKARTDFDAKKLLNMSRNLE